MQTWFSKEHDGQHTLVVVFLRGAADGLNMVIPAEDDGYYRARPTLAVSKSDSLALGGIFRLHPRLAPLERLFHSGDLAILHGVGSEDETRSHFEAQDLMERAGMGGGGWLARHLRHRPGPQGRSLSAVAIGESLPESLRGAPSATALESLDAFSLGADADQFAREIAGLYAGETGLLGDSARETLSALSRIEDLRRKPYRRDAQYPDSSFGNSLKLVAQLVKSGLGLEAASVDLDGWDSHFAQAALMNPLMESLSGGLAAFHQDLGKHLEHTSVVVMTEFGRRVAENSAFGTDHGRASVMLAMGGGIRGGRVIAKWPGLESGLLEGPGDLPVETNYRDVLASIIERHSSGAHLPKVFPGFALRPVELYAR